MKWFMIHMFLVFGLSLQAVASDSIQADSQSTALSFLLRAKPYSDLSDEKVKQELKRLKLEVETVYGGIFTELGHKTFYISSPINFGQVRIQFDDALTKELKLRLDQDRKIDLTQDSLGDKDLDALVDQFGGTQLFNRYDFSPTFELTIPKHLNPNIVAKAFRDHARVKFANSGNSGAIGESKSAERLGQFPPVYRFGIGWGDCPAGCIYKHFVYVEATRNGPVLVGETGSKLAPELRKALFK